MTRSLVHPDGGYRFAPGISPYSGGVVAEPGFTIHHVSLRRRVHWREGFELVAAELAARSRPKTALCGIELRCPRPHPFDGFGSFNDDYRAVLADWGVLVGDHNPVARTNVAPIADPPEGTDLHAFSYTAPTEVDDGPHVVVAGAGDLHDQSDLRPEAIVAPGETTPAAMAAKAEVVVGEMTARLSTLGLDWSAVTVVDVYTNEALQPLLDEVVRPLLGPAGARAITWWPSLPPIEGLAFEMDVRGGCVETWL